METPAAGGSGSGYGAEYPTGEMSFTPTPYYSVSSWSTTSSGATASSAASTRPSPMSVQSLISQPYEYQYDWPEYPDYRQPTSSSGRGSRRNEQKYNWVYLYLVEFVTY